ncbi:Flp pilus assembly protein CpaB [Heyndrickxia sp. NPDC080065]|uniref:Flp pilus assembly protein CpaB n=1 Tax=Heyndrickxia sp. NPDC080065 TaxID=3390568 RepID=UPI003CFF22D5
MLESKRRAIIFISISLILAIVAGVFFLQKVKQLNSSLGGMTKIYVAAADIPSRTLIRPNQVKTIEIPNKYVNKSYVTDVDDLINKVLVVPLSEEDIIAKSMIKPVTNATNENHRLVTIHQSEKVQFDQTVEALDRVDIIVSQKFGNAPKTEVFMKDVPVAAVINSDKKFSGVAVEISADDAPRLIHMQNYADSLRILKANVGKGDQITTQNVNSDQTQQDNASNQQKTEDKKKPEEQVKKDQEKGNQDKNGKKPHEANKKGDKK